MPKLHAQIRHVTTTSPVSLQPEDIVEPEAGESEVIGGRVRKRRRIETIANQYIKLGRRPLIVSAELRGPFNNGWKNPWVKVQSAVTGERESHGVERPKPTHAGANHSKADHVKLTSSDPSPEASRAPEIIQGNVLPPDDFPEEAHVSQDAPTTHEGDSGATEYFSVDPDPSITFNNFESNPFWLKRPVPRNADFGNSTSGNHDPSPTRARLGYRPIDQNGGLQLVTPRQPVLQSDSGQNAQPEPDWMSSASASMIITSTVKPTQFMQQTTRRDTSAKRKRTYSKYESSNTTGGQSASQMTDNSVTPNQTTPTEKGRFSQHSGSVQNRQMPPPDTRRTYHASGFIPINATSRSDRTVRSQETAVSGYRAQANATIHIQEVSTSAHGARKRPPKQDIEDSAGRCESTTSSVRSSEMGQKRKKKPAKGAVPSIRHVHITSPTLASSIGFTYRRVGGAKPTKPSPKPKARPVTFSSPAITDPHATELDEQGAHTMDEADEHEIASAVELSEQRPDVYDVPGSPQEQQQSFKSNRTSDFSTQAAFFLAQKEFQDGTMSMVAEGDDTVPWLNPSNSTQHEDPIVPSPAFTPFHKFNTTLTEAYPPEPPALDMPISTQDLFATVSPFAQSTVKKSARPPASNLRFSVFASKEQDTPSHVGTHNRSKSPTPSERKPLKDKNTRVSFLGSQSEKRSQSEKGSQESITPRASKAPTVQAMELPKLDFHTSLDDLRPSSDLNFTDRFLLNMKEMT